MKLIAELGLNHNGSFNTAVSMINAAAQAGADIAKFQLYDPAKLLGVDSPYFSYASSCQFTKAQLETLALHCDRAGIEFLVSVFDINDISWAETLCKRMKVASRMNLDEKFIARCAASGKEVIVSLPYGTKGGDKTYMYCVTNYPTALEDISLKEIAKADGVSSHCPSIVPLLAAYDLGCKVVEAHVTFSRLLPGCDQSSSLNFKELETLCKQIK